MDDQVLNEIRGETPTLESMAIPDLSITQGDLETYAPPMAKTINLGPRVKQDWDGDRDGLIGEIYEQYLQAVQQGKSMHMGAARHAGRKVRKYDRNVTFEDYLKDSLDVLRYRIEIELNREMRRGHIDIVCRDNNRDLAEACQRAITTYLEGTPRERMMGVPESGF